MLNTINHFYFFLPNLALFSSNFILKMLCNSFQAKWRIQFFRLKFAQKWIVGIRISIVKMTCMPIFRKNEQLDFFDQNLPKNGFWGQIFKILSPDSESASLRYCVHQLLDKTNKFEFLGPNLLKTGFRAWNFKVWIWLEWTPPYTMCTNFQLNWITFNFST